MISYSHKGNWLDGYELNDKGERQHEIGNLRYRLYR